MPTTDPLLAFVPMPFQQVFYPQGFPVRIRSNVQTVLQAAQLSWGAFPPRFQESAIDARYLICQGPKRRSPCPVFRAQSNLLIMIADEHNYATCDLSRGLGTAWLTEATINDLDYFRYTFLEGLVYVLLENLHLVAIHAACVVKDGHGVLLTAESGMGKSSLAYACACRGWTYVSDDASSLVRNGTGRRVIGNPRLFRFRPAAAALFPELREALFEPQTPARFKKGKPTFEVRTECLQNIRTAEEAAIDHIVFLKRSVQMTGSARLLPLSRKEALRRLLPDVWPAELAVHQQRSAAIGRLLDANLGELSYCDFDSAVHMLEQIVDRGS